MKKTTTEQFIDDLISSGIPLGNDLKEYFKQNKTKLKDVDKKFYSHIYPNKSLKWTKNYIKIELHKNITANSFMIFNAISNLINKNNLIQISQKEISNITNIKDLKTISKSIKELTEKGFIVIKINGNTKRNTIYMINPELITIGTGNQTKLKKEFWELTGSQYKLNNLEKPSKIHNYWFDLFEDENYIIGYDKIQINDEIINFNKLSIKEKQNKKMSVNLEKNTDTNNKNNKKTN